MKATEIAGAAARYQDRKLTGYNQSTSAGWQEQGWSYYSDGDTPEVGFASTWIGNAMRQATLFAGRRQPNGEIEPLEDAHPAVELVAQIAGGPAGQAELLAEFGPHLVVAGEGWILIRDNGTDWRVLSVLELSNRGGRLEATVDDEKVIVPGKDDATGDDDPVAIRVWDPHPRKHIEADSPVRRSLGLLNELRLLNASVAAIARSQLTGRGVIFVPQGTRFPSVPGTNSAEDDLIEVFMQVAETAYKDPESAAAAVPIILEVPENGKFDRLTFESEFDELAIKLREEAIRRFAAGLDTPAEVMLGMANTNHWNVWSLQQEAITLAVEPRLGLVCDALTTQWLRPLLESSVEDVDELVVWYDSSPLRVRTNRAQTAVEVQRAGGISMQALRRETGFDEADAPTDEERIRDLLFNLVAAAPSLAPLILPLLGVELNDSTLAPAAGRAPQDDTNGGDLPVDESPRPPEPPAEPELAREPDPGLLAATDGIVARALELAGKRLRSRRPRSERGRLQEVTAASVHTEIPVDPTEVDRLRLLEGAWDRVEEIAARYHVDAECLQATCDEYVRELLAAGVPHEWETTTAVVLRATCLTEVAA